MFMNLIDLIRRSAGAVARGFDRWMTAKDTSVIEPRDQWLESFHEANRTNIDPYGNLKRPGTVWGGPYGDI